MSIQTGASLSSSPPSHGSSCWCIISSSLYGHADLLLHSETLLTPVVQSWTITHMHWPDIDADDTRWESRVLRFMSPPEQLPGSRRRLYFSLFYTITHVFALMNVVIYWAVLVPSGHDHWPSKGSDDVSSGFFVIIQDMEKKNPLKGIMDQGWFPAFCLLNLYVFPAIITLIETTSLNSMRRPEVCVSVPSIRRPNTLTKSPQPVPSHLFGTILSAGLYLAYAAIGAKVTGHHPFFWMDQDKVGSIEKVTGYCAGFLVLAAASK